MQLVGLSVRKEILWESFGYTDYSDPKDWGYMYNQANVGAIQACGYKMPEDGKPTKISLYLGCAIVNPWNYVASSGTYFRGAIWNYNTGAVLASTDYKVTTTPINKTNDPAITLNFTQSTEIKKGTKILVGFSRANYEERKTVDYIASHYGTMYKRNYSAGYNSAFGENWCVYTKPDGYKLDKDTLRKSVPTATNINKWHGGANYRMACSVEYEDAQQNVYRWNGSNWSKTATLWRWNGSKWVNTAVAYRWNGKNWEEIK